MMRSKELFLLGYAPRGRWLVSEEARRITAILAAAIAGKPPMQVCVAVGTIENLSTSGVMAYA